jgi:hypothetical protein
MYICRVKQKAFIFLSLFIGYQAGIAQSFSLYYHDINLANDTELVRAGTTDSLELTTFLTIRNDAATEKRIQARKTEILMVPGTACSLCWAGYCYPTETFETSYPLVLAPGASETSCFAHFITGGTIGTSLVRWTYFDSTNVADSVSVLISYITYPMGIGSQKANISVVVSPNPADREVCFRSQDPAFSRCTITLSNASGRAVLTVPADGSGAPAQLDTSALPDGIYFYTLLSDGKFLSCGKLVVCH